MPRLSSCHAPAARAALQEGRRSFTVPSHRQGQDRPQTDTPRARRGAGGSAELIAPSGRGWLRKVQPCRTCALSRQGTRTADQPPTPAAGRAIAGRPCRTAAALCWLGPDRQLPGQTAAAQDCPQSSTDSSAQAGQGQRAGTCKSAAAAAPPHQQQLIALLRVPQERRRPMAARPRRRKASRR